jgi:exopolysaccharide production protein ExoZ
VRRESTLPQAPQKQTRRIISIQVCRGLAAMLVVLAHLHGIETKYCTTNHMLPFEHGALGIDLFFVISGIVIASVTADKFGNARDAVIFLYHRLARIFPIFWIYTTINLLARSFNPLGTATAEHPVNLLASYLLIPTHLPMLLLQGWTLSNELYFYFVFFLLLLLAPQRIVPWLLALWGIAVVGLKLWIGLSPHAAINVLISPSVLEFLAGCLIFHLYRRSRLHPAAGIVIIVAAFFWLAAILAYTSQAHPGQPTWIEDAPWLRIFLYGTFATLLLFGAIELERTTLLRYFPLVASIGDWSYSIYLSHILVLELIARLVFRILPANSSILIITLISLPTTIVIGYLSYTYLERPLMTRLYKPTQRQPAVLAK